MKILLWIFILGLPLFLRASMCFEMAVEDRLESNDVLFVGVVDSIITQSDIHSCNSIGWKKYLNLRVTKSVKGLSEDISMVSIFFKDRIDHYISVGDSIVVFANYIGNPKHIYNPNFLMLTCGTNRLNQFSKKDVAALEALTWKQHMKNVETKKQNNGFLFSKNGLLLFLLMSLLLNIVLIYHLLNREK